MNYQVESGDSLFEVVLEATSWHYEDNSIGGYDYHGYKVYDNRHKTLVVDEFRIVNLSDFSEKELIIIAEILDDDEDEILDMLIEELESRLDNSICTDDEDDD